MKNWLILFIDYKWNKWKYLRFFFTQYFDAIDSFVGVQTIENKAGNEGKQKITFATFANESKKGSHRMFFSFYRDK